MKRCNARVHISVSCFILLGTFPISDLLARYVRILKSPGLYGVGVDYQEDDDGLVQKRADIVHSAAA